MQLILMQLTTRDATDTLEGDTLGRILHFTIMLAVANVIKQYI